MAGDRYGEGGDLPQVPSFPPPPQPPTSSPPQYPSVPSRPLPPPFTEPAAPPSYGRLPPPPGPGRSSSGGRTIAIIGAAVIGLVLLAGVAFVIGVAVLRGEDAQEAAPAGLDAGPANDALPDTGEALPDANDATPDQLEEVTVDAELSRADEQCIEDDMDGQATFDDVLTDMTGDAREALMQAMLNCLAAPATSNVLVGAVSGNIELATNGQIDVDDREGGCLVQHVLDNSPNPARTLAEGDGPEDAELLFEALEICLDEADLALMTGAPGTGPQAYGDDDRLDGLQDDCTIGDERACDLLYMQSSVASEYEAYALDCGGRGAGEYGWCTPGVAFDADGQVATDDPGLLEQVALCQEGDLTACDFVYQVSPINSEPERIGFTCGGQIPIGALPDCRTRLG